MSPKETGLSLSFRLQQRFPGSPIIPNMNMASSGLFSFCVCSDSAGIKKDHGASFIAQARLKQIFPAKQMVHLSKLLLCLCVERVKEGEIYICNVQRLFEKIN